MVDGIDRGNLYILLCTDVSGNTVTPSCVCVCIAKMQLLADGITPSLNPTHTPRGRASSLRTTAVESCLIRCTLFRIHLLICQQTHDITHQDVLDKNISMSACAETQPSINISRIAPVQLL